jgi:hypothetical protein
LFNRDMVMLLTAPPAPDIEPFVEALHLNNNHGLVKNGLPSFLQLMVWMNEMKGKTCMADLPVGIQKFLVIVLAPTRHLRGIGHFMIEGKMPKKSQSLRPIYTANRQVLRIVD